MSGGIGVGRGKGDRAPDEIVLALRIHREGAPLGPDRVEWVERIDTGEVLAFDVPTLDGPEDPRSFDVPYPDGRDRELDPRAEAAPCPSSDRHECRLQREVGDSVAGRKGLTLEGWTNEMNVSVAPLSLEDIERAFHRMTSRASYPSRQ